MQEIEISKITIKDNVRKDYGDLTGLTASIKENGVRVPVEIDSNNELIDGHRRIKAAQAAGMNKVPYFVNDKAIPKTKMQIISGIFNEKLNAIEQGEAFRKYMTESKITAAQIAGQIGKTKDYVEKRLVLVNLPEEVKKELIGQRIQIGHALLLAKMPKPRAVEYMKDIIKAERGVENAKDNLQWASNKLKVAPFETEPCKECKYNGAVQSELFETGKILTGMCLDPSCYGKKVTEFVKAKKEEFKDVLFQGENDYETPKGYIASDSYLAADKGITKKYMDKCRKDRENYLVIVRKEGKINEFFRLPARKEVKTDKKAEKAMETKREEKLGTKVADYRRKFLIAKSKELLSNDSVQAKRLALIKMMLDNPVERTNAPKIEAVLKMTDDKKLNFEIAEYSKIALNMMDEKDLLLVSRDIGVDISKHFKITEEYLEMYTKEQLVELMDELDIDDHEKIDQTSKKPEIIKLIMKQDLKGKVPKVFIGG